MLHAAARRVASGYYTAAAAAAMAVTVQLQLSQESQSKRRLHAVEKTIGKTYTLQQELGQGAYAVVYHAKTKATGESVAVKVIGTKVTTTTTNYATTTATTTATTDYDITTMQPLTTAWR